MSEIELFDHTTRLVDVTLEADTDIVVHEGGTSSSKTYSLLQVCYLQALRYPGSIITVVGQDVPNLKKGAYRDAQTILNGSQILKESLVTHKRKEREIILIGGSLLEFQSYDDAQDAKSGKRDFLFVNEANGIGYETYEELAVRTERQVYIDFNPTARFWAHDKLKGLDNVRWVRSTFRHNPFVRDSIRGKILSYEPTEQNRRKGTANPYRWQVYGLGQPGRREGLVFPDFEVGSRFPGGHSLWGLDWGYTHHPTVLVEVRETEFEWWVREWIYEKGLTNSDIARRLRKKGFRSQKIVADSAEPKSIEELRREGFNVVGAPKGRDSILNGISLMKEKNIMVDEGSENLIEEFRSYSWETDRDGNPTNKPVDRDNHGIDGMRYTIAENNKIQEPWMMWG